MTSNQKHVLPFAKMEGLGNDYVYVREEDLPLAFADGNLPELARKISDRHFGPGGDGLVLIGPPSNWCKADFRMRIFNSDGSEAEMCGNASRCVGKYVYDRGLTAKTTLLLETRSGVKTLELETKKGKVRSVRVNMGQPHLAPAEIPVAASGDSFINRELAIGGRLYSATAVSMGNPHVVMPLTGLDSLDLAGIGPLFEHHPLFPERVNAEFVEVKSRSHIRMRVWERGAGETLACGTGACAAVVACVLNYLTDRAVTVSLPGGELYVEWGLDGSVYKTGPARHVFDGEYALVG